jgi:hypothetical protein
MALGLLGQKEKRRLATCLHITEWDLMEPTRKSDQFAVTAILDSQAQESEVCRRSSYLT